MTRLFLLGRTETVRPVTMASTAFVKAMLDPAVPNKERVRLLHQAADEHQNGYRESMTGRGLDRHLFALFVVSQGTNMKSEFLNRALSMQWRLSTSQQPQNQTGEWDPRRDAAQVHTRACGPPSRRARSHGRPCGLCARVPRRFPGLSRRRLWPRHR